jgi:hypothetical protein
MTGGMTGRVYLDPGDRKAGRYDPPRLCRVLVGWGPGGGPRNVAVEYLDDGSRSVIPFPRRLRRIIPAREARALVSEWIDEVRRSDIAWREPYTDAELAAVDAELDRFRASLPRPGESLFFRLRMTPEQNRPDSP